MTAWVKRRTGLAALIVFGAAAGLALLLALVFREGVAATFTGIVVGVPGLFLAYLAVANSNAPGTPELAPLADQHRRALGQPPQADTGQVVVGEIPREAAAFVARGAVERLAAVGDSGQVAVLYAVTGLRGVGKTQVAAAYARGCVAGGWGLVGWVTAETEDALLAGLARVADALGVADPDGDSAESARRLREHLDTRTDLGLLVFDNAADPDGLRRFLPAVGGTQIVVTSTDRGFAEMGVPVDVSVFTRAESTGYLAQRTGLADVPGGSAVAAELGDLPLALAQAAATITRRNWTFEKYLSELALVPVARLLGRIPGGDYPRSTAPALLLSVQSAEDADPSGLTNLLLRVVAVLSEGGVRRELLDGLASVSGAAIGEVDAALERCAAESLLTWSVAGDAVMMHRLLGRVLRERDQAAGCWQETVHAALKVLDGLLIPEEQAWTRRAEGADLAMQVEALWSEFDKAGAAGTAQAERLLRQRSWAVRQLRAGADFGRAIGLGTVVLADCMRLLGPDNLQTLTSREDLGVALRAAGRLDEATQLLEQNFADRLRVLGQDDPQTLESGGNLAVAYRLAGQQRKAIALHEQDLADRLRVLGPDDPQTLTSQNSLAFAYRSAGRLTDAITLFEQTVADRVRVVGPDNPQTLMSRNDLADAYREAGRLTDAITLLEQTLADRLRVLGPDHPQTLTSRNDLAFAYREAGRLHEAIALYRQILVERDSVLGSDHPATLISRNNLAFAYRKAGRLDEAILMYEQTLASRERVLGADHPETLLSRNNLAMACLAAGRPDEAVTLLEQNLADRLRVLGPDNPRTMTSRKNLGKAYLAAGRQDEAIALYEQTLADRLRVLGPDHPQTLTSREDLANAYREAGRQDEAIASE